MTLKLANLFLCGWMCRHRTLCAEDAMRGYIIFVLVFFWCLSVQDYDVITVDFTIPHILHHRLSRKCTLTGYWLLDYQHCSEWYRSKFDWTISWTVLDMNQIFFCSSLHTWIKLDEGRWAYKEIYTRNCSHWLYLKRETLISNILAIMLLQQWWWILDRLNFPSDILSDNRWENVY